MSARLLEFLEKIRVFTGKADRYLRAAGKALLMLTGLRILARFGRSWGQHFLTAPVIAVFTAAAAFLPAGFFTFGVFVAALGMLFQLSLEAALLMLLASLLMLVLYYSFRPHHGVIAGVFLVMVLAGFPEAALLVLPLFVTPFALIPMAFGYLGAVYLQTVAGNFSSRKRCPMLSAKHEPTKSMCSKGSIWKPGFGMSTIVLNSILFVINLTSANTDLPDFGISCG